MSQTILHALHNRKLWRQIGRMILVTLFVALTVTSCLSSEVWHAVVTS